MKNNIIAYLFVLFAITSISGCQKKTENPAVVPKSENLLGTIKDYTGLDGCGYVIELDNGEVLEPVIVVDTSFQFIDGKKVALVYTEIDALASICMVGKIVRIDWIAYLNCEEIYQDFNSLSDFVDDGIMVDSVFIKEDCIYLNLEYEGGCGLIYGGVRLCAYILALVQAERSSSATSEIQLRLFHNKNDDTCEALIKEQVQFDLMGIQLDLTNELKIVFTATLGDSLYYIEELIYSY
jgi:hypothetical protein